MFLPVCDPHLWLIKNGLMSFYLKFSCVFFGFPIKYKGKLLLCGIVHELWWWFGVATGNGL